MRLEVVWVQARLFHQQRIKLRLDGADRNVLPIRRFIGVIKVRAAVEQIRATLSIESTACRHGIKHRHQCSGTIDHGRINYLSLVRFCDFEQTADHAVSQQHTAAAKITHQIQWRYRALAGTTNSMKRAS